MVILGWMQLRGSGRNGRLRHKVGLEMALRFGFGGVLALGVLMAQGTVRIVVPLGLFDEEGRMTSM